VDVVNVVVVDVVVVDVIVVVDAVVFIVVVVDGVDGIVFNTAGFVVVTSFVEVEVDLSNGTVVVLVQFYFQKSTSFNFTKIVHGKMNQS